MKALGQLAGGIAHDFANILGGIMGYAEFLQDEAASGSEQEDFASQILVGVERATHRIRTFRQVISC